jgi:hypothetical protein
VNAGAKRGMVGHPRSPPVAAYASHFCAVAGEKFGAPSSSSSSIYDPRIRSHGKFLSVGFLVKQNGLVLF